MTSKKILSTLAVLCVSAACYAQTYTMANASVSAQYATTCSGTFVDNGGAGGNYANGVHASYTFYPSTAGQYMRLTFTVFNTQLISDYMAIYDGPGGPLIGQYSGNAGAFTVTASASNPTRALTCRFRSNGTTNGVGWSATVSCVIAPGTAPAFTPNAQDCQQGGGTTICNNANLTANSSGDGSVSDLANPWDGCLSGGENQSSWYYFSPSTSGTVGFTIAPQNGIDDYDFAIWGPFNEIQCPMNTTLQPLRCSYSGLGGNTGCGNGAVDVSEGAGGDKWVSTFPAVAGDVYVMVIDNYVSSGNPFTLTWSLTGGASLDCTVLPVELVSFWGEAEDDHHLLQWQTASELNNDYFVVERSVNGAAWDSIGTIDGEGNSTQTLDYSFRDYNMQEGISYYRLRQRDFNGFSTFSEVIYIVHHDAVVSLTNIYPMPTDGDITFDYTTTYETTVRVVITDIAGRVVVDEQHLQQSGNNSIKTSIADEPAGSYMLSVTDEITGKVSVARIVKY
ncbi:MAG TPA: T9SS type A sorting domain-containing protein [Bacteroidia bacterium]|nr:T9SS type A sorting domain-containing protein [Bacteroidia bacterium]